MSDSAINVFKAIDDAIDKRSIRAEESSFAPAPGSPATTRNPVPKWHDELQQWVLVISEEMVGCVRVIAGNGRTYFPSVQVLKDKPEND